MTEWRYPKADWAKNYRPRSKNPLKYHVMGSDGTANCGAWDLDVMRRLPRQEVPEESRCRANGCGEKW